MKYCAEALMLLLSQSDLDVCLVQAYTHFVATQVTTWLWASAHLEWYIQQYQLAAQNSHELHLLLQRPNTRLYSLTEVSDWSY